MFLQEVAIIVKTLMTTNSLLMYFLPLLIAVLVICSLYLVWRYTRKPILSTYRKDYYYKKICACEHLSNRESIIECDNILSHVLRELGYRGNLGDQLRKKPYVVRSKLDELWQLHRLRNKIVHELDIGKIREEDVRRYRDILKEMLG